MKKYVRTEDHIYEIKIDEDAKNNNVVNYFYCEERFDDNVVWLLFEEEELKQYKQADTIEKLCDMYVLDKIDIIYINKEHTEYRFENSEEWFIITYTELRRGIYGAIWTDKGLTYAAKMNKDGKFELI